MSMWRLRIFYIFLGLIVIGIVSESVLTKPTFKLEGEAKVRLSNIPGKIELRLVADKIWNYSIINGELSLKNMEKYHPGWMDEKRMYVRFAKEVPEGFPMIQGFKYYGAYSVSPDKSRMFLALSSEKEEYYPRHFVIIEMKNRGVLIQGRVGNNVEDMAWSPDSSMFVVLEASSRRSFSVAGILHILIGHPSDVYIFYLSLYYPKGTLLVRTKVASGLVDGSDQVSWDIKVKPLPSKLKGILKKEMTLNEVENIIGPCHDVFGSGVSWFVWYFDDDSCLVIFYAGKEGESRKEWYWYKSKPGGFSMNVSKDKSKLLPRPE